MLKKILKEVIWIVVSLVIAILFEGTAERYAIGSDYVGFPLSLSIGFGAFLLTYSHRWHNEIRELIHESFKNKK